MISPLALIVVIVIDQFRADQLIRAQKNLNPAGIGLLVNRGVFYDDAHHSQFFNMTCPGHVALSTGAPAGLHGIMLNDDWDPVNRKSIYCVSDPKENWLDAEADTKGGFVGTSGVRILTTTVGDEMKTLWKNQNKVVSLALKDRSAIGMAGHRADGVYWFAPKSKIWTTSTYYSSSKTLPKWLQNFNASIQRKSLDSVDYGKTTEAIQDETNFALAAIKAEDLGNHKRPDLLWISYSTHDFVGHETGDDSPQLRATLHAEDENIAKLIKSLQKKLGSKKMLIFLTGDHGAGFDTSSDEKIPGGKLNEKKFQQTLSDCLKNEGIKSKTGKTIEFLYSMNLFLSDDIEDKKLARVKAKACLKAQSRSVLEAYTRDEILSGQIPRVPWLKNLESAYNPERGADVIGVLRPYWNSTDDHIINHETPYDYDSWVPLVFWYNGIKKAQIHRRVDLLSLAPTLSRILETRRPSGATAEYLPEVLENLTYRP